jgi:hypothetical protein
MNDCGPGYPSWSCGDGKCTAGIEFPAKCPFDCNCNSDTDCKDGKVCFNFACITSCKGKCGKFSNLWACQCDAKCQPGGDCCPDKQALCGG